MADPATLPPRQLIALAIALALAIVIALASALPIGLTQPEPGGFAKPELERTRFIATPS